MRHLAFKRSDIAHGRVRSIDTSSAEAMHGVEAVFTGGHIAGFLVPMPIGTPFPSPEHRAVAVDTVRFVGDPVAVVVACDRYVARDAADAVEVDYEPLPAVVDPEKAMSGESVVLHAGFPNNVALGPLPSGTGVGRKGAVDDTAVDAAFEAADVVIEQRMVNQRLAPSSIEARGVVAHYEPGREALTIWSSTQNPHILRTFLAQTLGLGEDRVRAIAPEVGGGFGVKINIYGEEYVAAALSKRLGLPVKWIEDRSEAFLATVHGRDLIWFSLLPMRATCRVGPCSKATARAVQVRVRAMGCRSRSDGDTPAAAAFACQAACSEGNTRARTTAVGRSAIGAPPRRTRGGAPHPQPETLRDRSVPAISCEPAGDAPKKTTSHVARGSSSPLRHRES